MGNVPAISIIMPLYRSQKFLKESIDSVIKQTFSDFEFLILVDDASEETVSILDEYRKSDNRINIFYNSNLGLINSLNMGFEKAKGKYVARMDSDDVCFPSRLEKQYVYMEAHPEIGILGTGYTTSVYHPINNPGLIKWRLIYDNCLTHSSIVIRSSIIKEIGNYRLGAKYAEDYDLWVRASHITNIANHQDVLMKYRFHDENVSSINLGDQEKMVQEIVHANFYKLLNYEVPLEKIMAIRQFVRGNRLNDPDKINSSIKMLTELYQAFIQNNELKAGEISLITNDLAIKILKNALKESGLPLSARAKFFFNGVVFKLKSYSIIVPHIYKN
jgi:glycosyltransferase involved in cell wall biosynthesis